MFVLNFLRQFHQNSLFGNVNLDFERTCSTEETDHATLLTTLSYVLPLIKDNINSIRLWYSDKFSDFYNSNSDMAMEMLNMPRILGIR
jgi:hypothetical protein